jgi:uncharacterized membrane protein
VAVIQTFLGIAYPALIYLALKVAEPRTVAAFVLLLVAARLALLSPERLLRYARALGLPVLAVGLVLGATALWNNATSLLLTPTLISFALLVVFARSMVKGETVIERFARVQAEDLSEEEIRYCRRVTGLWCAFFLLNGIVASWLAVVGDLETWALYTAFLAYVLIGIIFASEFVYRQWRFRRYVGAPTDPFFRRVFPPRGGEVEARRSVRSPTSR